MPPHLLPRDCLPNPVKDRPVAVTGIPAGRKLLDGERPVSGALTLDGYGCAIVELN
ncbi:hypothetical protein [Mesorhizobium sp.]|uniref:hypothetical protein n=1 Tax=Mesorhizobium sp. TaxID=1871066 RepID=UPI0025F48C2A|nr:hypothetical protein [Mesorhizobium sp.]